MLKYAMTVKKHLTSALLVLKVDKEKSKLPRLDPKSKPALNANYEKQPRFFSTKRKRQSKARLPKPSHEGEESTWNELVTTEITVCDYCCQEEDDGDDPDIAVQIVVSGYTHHVFIVTLLIHLIIFVAKDVFKINSLK